MDFQVETTISPDVIMLLVLATILAGAFLLMLSRLLPAKK